MKSKDLIQDLRKRTKAVIVRAEECLDLPAESLTYTDNPERWNAFECIAHLNLYGDFYLPAITEAIESQRKGPTPEFKSSWLGNYFAESMIPTGKNKMKTFKSKNPQGQVLSKLVIQEFLNQQKTMLKLLEGAEQVHLRKTKVKTTIGSWLKVNLGDILRVVIYHNERHLKQADGMIGKATA